MEEATVEFYKDGQHVLDAKDYDKALYFIVEGGVINVTGDGEAVWVPDCECSIPITLGPVGKVEEFYTGQIFGMPGFLKSVDTTFRKVIASGDTNLCKLAKEGMQWWRCWLGRNLSVFVNYALQTC